MTITDLVQSIDGRLQAIQTEISSLEDAKRALANGAAPAPTPRVPAKRTTRPARPRPTKSVRTRRTKLTSETLEQLLTVNNGDGITTSALAEQASGKHDQVLALLRELEAKGNVRRTGQRRGTRWHVITDEDRIAARVAELERASKYKRPAKAGHTNSRKATAKRA